MKMHVVTVTSATPIWQTLRTMEETGRNFVPVVENRIPIGVVTAHDLTQYLKTQGESAESSPTSEAMTTPVYAVCADLQPEDATSLMRKQHVHRLVVTEGDGRLCGTVSMEDLVPVRNADLRLPELYYG